ncbi:MAG: hypothetical protein QNK23_14350 [Crocinitomicaceae bacterium]|nr:hypothetical protein [Crocinitomicaceae bacterium]
MPLTAFQKGTMARIKPTYARNYLCLGKDSFHCWCKAVGIEPYKYEFSDRSYFISGEFYALADKNDMKRLKELHGDQWHEFYDRYEEVKAFLTDKKEPQPIPAKRYQPKSGQVADFINNLNK